MAPVRCCICRSSAKKRTHPTASYEEDIFGCFSVRSSERISPGETSRICSTCEGAVQKYRKTGLKRPDLVKTQALPGQHGHRKIGGKRMKLMTPVRGSVSLHESQSPSPTPSTASTTSYASTSKMSDAETSTEITGEQIDVSAKKLSHLSNCSPLEPLNRDQKILFHKMATSALANQASGKQVKNFQTRPAHGPGLNLFCAPKSRVSSSTCSRQTRNNRSEAIEEFQVHMSCDGTSSEEETAEAVTAQRATMFKRNKDSYVKALEAAGFKTLAKFSRETVLNLRSRIPMESWQYVKRALSSEMGINLMGLDNELKAEVAGLEFEYECVSFQDDATG